MSDNEKLESIIRDIVCKYRDKKEQYSGSTCDKMYNFNATAKLMGISPERALLGFMAKQVVHIYTPGVDRCNDTYKDHIIDVITYLITLYMMIEEKEKK